MQNFGSKDLSHVRSRRNLLKYLVRVEMASDWFTRIYRSIFAEQNFLHNRDMACKLGCGLFLSPQQVVTINAGAAGFLAFSNNLLHSDQWFLLSEITGI